MRGTVSALVTVVALASCGTAAAESHGNLTEARQRFDRGMDLFLRGDLEAALADFVRAYEIAPNSAVLYNIGTVQSRLRRYADAATTLERYLNEGGESVPADRRTEVERELERLRGLVGRLRISVRPQTPAVVLVDGAEAGRLPASAPLAVSAGRHEVEVRAEGFLPYRREVTVAGGAEAEVEAVLSREAPPGAVMISVSVPYAEVTIDGETVGTTPLEEPVAVTPGRHVVEVSRSGYPSAQETVEVREGQVTRLELTLEPLPELPPELAGALDVRVSEQGVVRFLLDGSPLPEGTVPVGPHHLEVHLEGFEPWEGEVEVERGQPTRLEVALTPTPGYRQAYERSARAVQIGGYASLGTAGVLLLVGMGLEIWNGVGRQGDWQSEDDFLQSQYRLDQGDPSRLPREQLVSRQDANDELASGITGLRIADCVMLGLGGAAVIVGVLLLVLGPDPDRFESVSIGPAPGGLALAW